MAKGFFLGFVVAIAAVVAGGYFFVTTGALPAGQDTKPSELEEWAARPRLGNDSSRGSGVKVPCPTD